MPLTSHASAADEVAASVEAAAEPPAAVVSDIRKPSTLSLWPEAAREVARHGFDPLFAFFRRGWFYRQMLSGPVPDRIVFNPPDPSPKRLEDADAMFRGRFRFAGATLEVREGSVFDLPAPSAGFAASLHGFAWLRHLEAAGSEAARELALKLTAEWLVRHARYSEPAWLPEIIAERLLNLFAHGRFFLHGSDVMWRSRLFVSVRNQARVLARRMGYAPEGLPRLQASAGLALAGICLADARNMDEGLAQLRLEIERQILPDGGHMDRSPESLVRAFLLLTMVQQALEGTHKQVPQELRGARDRMAPMIRFFRLGDGALAVFNGGGESEARIVSALLESDEVRGMPFGHARYSAYQRLAGGRTLVLLDTGMAPPGAFSLRAHAGCLSFEMSSGPQRLIVNCGASVGDERWDAALRATAAHSTLTLADTSSAFVLSPGLLRDLLGPQLFAGPQTIDTRRNESGQGILVEATHDGYAASFGLLHERRLALSPKGLVLTGADRLLRAGRKSRRRNDGPLPFAIRFHVHPDVRMSFAQAGGSVMLRLPNGEGWRFRASGGTLAIEESIYFGGGSPRRAEQLVISGTAKDEPVQCDWVLELAGAA